MRAGTAARIITVCLFRLFCFLNHVNTLPIKKIELNVKTHIKYINGHQLSFPCFHYESAGVNKDRWFN